MDSCKKKIPSVNKFKLSCDDFYKGCCGKIFLTNKKLLVMHCVLCDAKFGSFRRFVDHLSAVHYYDWRFFGSESNHNAISHKNNTKPLKNETISNCTIDRNIISRDNVEEEHPINSQHQDEKHHSNEELPHDGEPAEDENEDIVQNHKHDTTNSDDGQVISEITVHKLLTSTEQPEVEKPIDFLKESCGIKIESIITAEELEGSDTFFLSDDDLIENDNDHEDIECEGDGNGDGDENNEESKHESSSGYYPLLKKKKYLPDDRERNHICDVCNSKFTDRSNMMAHKRRHSGKKDHLCPECPKRFYTRSELKTHMCFHTRERPFICSTCGRGFLTSGAMTGHMRRHTNERRYKCEFCDKSFFDSTQLKDHTVSHTKVREYTCEVCQSTFMLYKTLRQHMKIHANKREYVCYICNAAYNQSPALFLHMKKHGVKLHQNKIN